MRLKVSRENDVTTLRIAGELNADSVARFKDAVAEALAEQHRDFVVDLKATTLIDSAGLEALTALERQCEEELGLLRVVVADEVMRKVFEITRLDKRLTLCESAEEALAAFSQG